MIELNKIYNENCLHTMQRMPNNCIDLTVTSPPYDKLRDYKGYKFPFKHIARHLYRVTKFGGVVVWVVGDATINGSETGTSFKQALYFKEVGFNIHDTMIYEKDGCPFPENIRYYQCYEYMFILSKGRPSVSNLIRDRKNFWDVSKSSSTRSKNGETTNKKNDVIRKSILGTRFNIWRITNGFMKSSKDEISFNHPASFPEQLAADHIKSWSNEGDLIYDPFTGSGTTLKMAHLLKRNWIGSEISKEYCELAEKRLKPYLQQLQIF